MVDPFPVGPALESLSLVGIVLVEALVLYVGYGRIETVIEGPVEDVLRDE